VHEHEHAAAAAAAAGAMSASTREDISAHMAPLGATPKALQKRSTLAVAAATTPTRCAPGAGLA
jgi:hypothetical protein